MTAFMVQFGSHQRSRTAALKWEASSETRTLTVPPASNTYSEP